MARLYGDPGSAITLVMALSAILTNPFAAAQNLYDQPVLIVDPDTHTARINAAAVDTARRFIATGSSDKTVRIWSASDGRLLQTIRMPAGPGEVGEIYTVAMTRDGDVVAAGGTEGLGRYPIYLFDPSTGKITERITADLPAPTAGLVFSVDGRYLAATLYSGGLRVFGRDQKWSEVFRDIRYGDTTHGASFADDGRLATGSYDGWIRLYDRAFHLVALQRAPIGYGPAQIAFSPDGNVLAVGYMGRSLLGLLDGHTLAQVPGPNTASSEVRDLKVVSWSDDGQTLYAAGLSAQVLAWDRAADGRPRVLPTCGDRTVLSLVSLSAGELLIATADPCLEVMGPDGGARWTHRPGVAGDFRFQKRSFAVSGDGMIVDFGFEANGGSPARFNLRDPRLSSVPPPDGLVRPPKQDGLSIEGWDDTYLPKLNGELIRLSHLEVSRSLAIHPDGHRFVLGASFSLRAFDADGKALWTRAAPGGVWAVNITGDGRLVVAAYGDNTIRWHDVDDGRELLALQVLSNRNDWVAWTPEGIYAATPGARGVLRWQINRGTNAAADAVSPPSNTYRPDALPLVLRELGTERALGKADMAAARRDIQLATRAENPPGARLHVLAIGINDYGDKAKLLHLNFANKDAYDVASALVSTQDGEFNKFGGLYTEVLPQYLHDATATKDGIFAAFDTVQRNMAKDHEGQDLAVVMPS